MKFVKNNIKFIIVIVICLVGSSITTLATNYLFNSNEVSYDNTNSGLHADYVQGAIDEVFQHATDYSEIKTKIGSDTLTTTSNTLIGSINELNSNKINTSAIANNLTTTASGSVLDARQGKTLNNNIGTLSSLTTTAKTSTVAAINEINNNLYIFHGRLDTNGYNNNNVSTAPCGIWYTGGTSFLSAPTWSYMFKPRSDVLIGTLVLGLNGDSTGKLYYYGDNGKFERIVTS